MPIRVDKTRILRHPSSFSFLFPFSLTLSSLFLSLTSLLCSLSLSLLFLLTHPFPHPLTSPLDDEVREEKVWDHFWQQNLLPTLKGAVGCHTDIVGICMTPYRRNRPTGYDPTKDASLWLPGKEKKDKKEGEDEGHEGDAGQGEKQQSFSCTSFLVRAWASCGIDLLENVGVDGVYPSEFLSSPYLELHT